MAEIPVEGGLNREGRVSSGETPAAAAQAGVPPTPGGEREVREVNIDEVYIDLEDLYLTVSGPAAAAAEVLKALLDAWGVGYTLLYNDSPDAGIEYFDPEFERIAEKYEESDEDDWLFSAAREYARALHARALVVLYDGYERAAAVIFDDDC